MESVFQLCVMPPTVMSSLRGRTATRHRHREVAIEPMTSQELASVLYIQTVAITLSSEFLPPTVRSCPRIEAHAGEVNGVSVSLCHTSGLTNDKVFGCTNRDCGLRDWRRAASEQVNTDLDSLPLRLRPPSM